MEAAIALKSRPISTIIMQTSPRPGSGVKSVSASYTHGFKPLKPTLFKLISTISYITAPSSSSSKTKQACVCCVYLLEVCQADRERKKGPLSFSHTRWEKRRKKRETGALVGSLTLSSCMTTTTTTVTSAMRVHIKTQKRSFLFTPPSSSHQNISPLFS